MWMMVICCALPLVVLFLGGSTLFEWGLGWFGGGIMMIVFWALLIGLIVWIVREFGGRNLKSNPNALDILKERYVKGEISKSEFDSMKKDIA